MNKNPDESVVKTMWNHPLFFGISKINTPEQRWYQFSVGSTKRFLKVFRVGWGYDPEIPLRPWPQFKFGPMIPGGNHLELLVSNFGFYCAFSWSPPAEYEDRELDKLANQLEDEFAFHTLDSSPK